MKNILIAGGSGLVGKRLTDFLIQEGFEVGVLSRSDRESDRVRYFQWDPKSGDVDPACIAWADGLINLAGEGIADKRWTEDRKAAITESRVTSNRVLLTAFQKAGKMPKAYLSAGGMNYYGDSGDHWRSETDPKGDEGFLPKSCARWEAAVDEWAQAGIRTVQFRISIVLSTQGGALPKIAMTLPVGIVPYFGNGMQWYSWIHIDDLCRMFVHALKNTDMSGIYNAASPFPVQNKSLAKQLLTATDRSGLTPSVPAFALKLGMGDMSETVLSSVRLEVSKIKNTGFKWNFPELVPALKDLYKHEK